jgi:hypothetical protein
MNVTLFKVPGAGRVQVTLDSGGTITDAMISGGMRDDIGTFTPKINGANVPYNTVLEDGQLVLLTRETKGNR